MYKIEKGYASDPVLSMSCSSINDRDRRIKARTTDDTSKTVRCPAAAGFVGGAHGAPNASSLHRWGTAQCRPPRDTTRGRGWGCDRVASPSPCVTVSNPTQTNALQHQKADVADSIAHREVARTLHKNIHDITIVAVRALRHRTRRTAVDTFENKTWFRARVMEH